MIAATTNAEAWAQVGGFAGLVVAAWWCGPFPHAEATTEPGVFDPASKSWYDHSHHMARYDPGLTVPERHVQSDAEKVQWTMWPPPEGTPR